MARDTGLARESLYKALSADGNPEFSTIMKVIKALGLKLSATRVEHAQAACLVASWPVMLSKSLSTFTVCPGVKVACARHAHYIATS